MNPVVITVRGEAQQRIAPEHGVARVTAASDGPRRSDVVTAVAELAESARTTLTALQQAGTVTEWSSEQTRVWSERPWNEQGQQLDPVHHAAIDLSGTFTDTVALSRWLDEISEFDGIQIGGISWELTPATRAEREREVAASAVTDAVARATAYAQALGLSTVSVIELADVGLLGDQGAPPVMALRAAKAEAAYDGGAGPSGLAPADIVVEAAVEARFHAS